MKPPPAFLLAAVALAAATHPAVAQGPNQPALAPEPAIQTGGEVAAAAAVEVWFGLVDDNRFPESWQSGASIFKKAVTQDQWVTLMKARRQPLGKMLTRKNISRQFTRTIPGAPDGQYVVLQYDSSFEKKPSAVETIISLLDVDGHWRVAGYRVH